MTFDEIVVAQPIHLDSTMELFRLVTDKMLEEHVDQWNHDYPDRETVLADINAKEQYIILDEGQVIASVALNDAQDPQYHNIHWKTRNKDIFSIHRLGVSPNHQGKGLGKKLCLFAEELAKRKGKQAIRLDAYAGNVGSNALYLKLGYIRANGYCYFRKKAIPFYCYEKKL